LINAKSTLVTELRRADMPLGDLAAMSDSELADYLEESADEFRAGAEAIRARLVEQATRPSIPDPVPAPPNPAASDPLGGPLGGDHGLALGSDPADPAAPALEGSAEIRPDSEPEPEPVVFVWPELKRRQVSEADARTAVSMLGDNILNDYIAGRGMSKAEAYAMAARRLRERRLRDIEEFK
jgi:hypothetical protein